MPIRVITGFEQGTLAGAATGNAGVRFCDQFTAACSIDSTNVHTGTYALRINPTAADGRMEWTTSTIATGQNRGRLCFYIRFNSLPSSDVVVANIPTTGADAELIYSAGDGGIRAKIAGGTSPAVASISSGTWYHVEMYLDCSSATSWTLQWAVDGTTMTSSTLGVAAAATIDNMRLGGGGGASQTFDVTFDDVIIETDTAAMTFPIGKHKVEVLTPVATLTTNNSANFNVMSANSTVLTWDATTALGYIQDRPPTIGSTADGIAQVTNGTTSYVEIPMSNYTLQSGETVYGARMLAPGWAAAATAATIGFRSYNGTTETTLYAAADPNFDNSTTTPAWVCAVLTTADINTQSELDALAFRVGFSGDAAPDIGIHAIYAEVAISESTSTPKTGTETGSGVDAATLATDLTATETGSGTEASTLATTLTAADTSTSVESATVEKHFSSADTASGSETATLTTAISTADTSSSVDVTTDFSRPVAEISAGIDAATLATTVSSSDTASAVETETQGKSFDGADTGTSVEAITDRAISSPDTGSTAESMTVAVTLTASDTGSASESHSLQAGGERSDGDTGTAAEAVTSRSLTASDTASSVESASLDYARTVTETASASETQVRQVEATSADVAAGTESATVATALSSAEVATAVESAVVEVTLSTADTGSAAESQSLQEGELIFLSVGDFIYVMEVPGFTIDEFSAGTGASRTDIGGVAGALRLEAG